MKKNQKHLLIIFVVLLLVLCVTLFVACNNSGDNKPGDSDNAITPNNPTSPTGPTNPTNPSNPSNPSDPTTPDNPTTPTDPSHYHDFSKQVVSDEYIYSSANCQSPAKYYYSCECGEMGNSTFEYGSIGTHDYKEEVVILSDSFNLVTKCRFCSDVSDSKEFSYTKNLMYDLNSDGNSYTLTGVGGFQGGNLIVPASLSGFPITAIADEAFKDNSAIEGVYLLANVKTIGESAFV